MNLDLSPRQQILAYLSSLIVLSLWAELNVINAGTVYTTAFCFLVAIPGVLSVIGSLIFGHEFQDLGLRPPAPKYLVLAYVIPAALTLLIVATIAIGIAPVELPSTSAANIKLFLFTPSLWVLIEGFSALAQELGWRGFLHARLQEAGITRPNLVIGLIWSVWYWPLILFCDLAPSSTPIIAVILFTISNTSFALILGWLRERSDSLWPAILAHAVRASFMLNFYHVLVKSTPLETLIGGSAGLAGAIMYLCAAILILNKN